MRANQVAQQRLSPEAKISRHGEGWTVLAPDSRLRLFNSELDCLGDLLLPDHGPCAVSPATDRVAISGQEHVTVTDSTGAILWQVDHPSWSVNSGSCAFSADGETLWALVPGPDTHDEWWVMGAADGTVRHRVPLRCATVGSASFTHVSRDFVAADLGTASRFGWIAMATAAPGRARARVREADGEVLIDLHPTDDRYLTLPFDTSTMSVRRFPDGEVLASATDCGRLDTAGGFLDPGQVLVTEFDGATFTADVDTLRSWEPVEYPPEAVTSHPVPNGAGGWVTYDADTGTLCAWANLNRRPE